MINKWSLILQMEFNSTSTCVKILTLKPQNRIYSREILPGIDGQPILVFINIEGKFKWGVAKW